MTKKRKPPRLNRTESDLLHVQARLSNPFLRLQTKESEKNGRKGENHPFFLFNSFYMKHLQNNGKNGILAERDSLFPYIQYNKGAVWGRIWAWKVFQSHHSAGKKRGR